MAPAKYAGRSIQSKKRTAKCLQEFGSTHSTLRTGEPFTWGRGRQIYAARKGNIIRTAGLEEIMQTSLRGIARKAKQSKKHKFGNLYGLLNKEALYLAWRDINKNASSGVDKETAKEFAMNLDANLDQILEELKTKRYKAKLVKRVNIPKGLGKTRPLGLPTLRDKIVQRAAARILEAIYEQDFYKSSYGYRPGVGPLKAAKDLDRELMGRYSYVVEADIKVIAS